MAEPKRPAVRERIAEALESVDPDALRRFVQEALAAERTIWTTCPTCEKRHEVEVPDWGARANVIDKLLTQGYGRPRSEDEEAGAGFVLRRVLVFRSSDPDRAAAEAQAAYGGVVTSAADGTRTVVIEDDAAQATDTLPAA